MKKFIKVVIKIILSFSLFIAVVAMINIPSSNPIWWRFYAEIIPYIGIFVISIFFTRIVERGKIKIRYIGKNPLKDIVEGVFIGLFWIGITFYLMKFLHVIKIQNNYESTSMLWLWIISLVVNAFMQELLIRGYMYELVKKEYNIVVAFIFTTCVFTAFHGGAFEAGFVAVINVVTMSLLMTILLEISNSLLLVSIVHGCWNVVGGIIIGGITLADDYPHLLNTTFVGNKLLSGGNFKIEGSLVVTIINITMIVIFSLLLKKNRNKSKLR